MWIIIASKRGKGEKGGSASSDLYSQSADLFKPGSRACENERWRLERTEGCWGKPWPWLVDLFSQGHRHCRAIDQCWPQTFPWDRWQTEQAGMRQTFIGELFYYRSSLLEEQRPATLIEREVQPRKVHIHQEEQHRRILTAGVVSSL